MGETWKIHNFFSAISNVKGDVNDFTGNLIEFLTPNETFRDELYVDMFT